jgi:hypothetical protein
MLSRLMYRFCATATLAIAMTSGASAVPSTYSQPRVDAAKLSSNLINKAVTAAGVAHRSSRRTARRVSRRHGY